MRKELICVLLAGMCLAWSHGARAETFSDDFNSGAVDKTRWTREITGGKSSITFEDAGGGDKRIHLRAVHDGNNQRVWIDTAEDFPNASYVLEFDLSRPSDELSAYGFNLWHGTFWYVEFNPGGGVSLHTFERKTWAGNYAADTPYRVKIENKPKQVKLTLSQGERVTTSGWRPHGTKGGSAKIRFNVSCWGGVTGAILDNVKLDIESLKIEEASHILKELQFVEGFSSILSFEHHADSYPDYRGGKEAWWMYCKTKPQEIGWLTAPVPEKKETCFVWIGANGEEYWKQARLYLNDEEILLMETAVKEDRAWEGNGCRLFFDSKGYFVGNSGVYYLSVPAEKVTAGKPSKIRIASPGSATETPDLAWFMVSDYRNVLEREGTGSVRKIYLSSFMGVKRREFKISEGEYEESVSLVSLDLAGCYNGTVDKGLLDALGLSQWFKDDGIIVAGQYPFRVRPRGKNIMVTSFEEEEDLTIPVQKKASEIFLLMGASLGKHVSGYRKVGRQIGSISEPDDFVVRIVYEDGREDEVFPESVETGTHAILGKLSLYSVKPRFFEKIREIVISDGMTNGAFFVAGITLDMSVPTEQAQAPSKPVKRVSLKKARPRVTLAGDRLVLENAYFRYAFSLGGSFEIEEIFNKYSGDDCLKGKGNLFTIRVGSRELRSSDCRVVEARHEGRNRISLSLVPGESSVPLLLTLSLGIDPSPELVSSLSLENRGNEEIKLRVFFPDLQGLRVGDSVEDNHYFFPYLGGIIGKVPFEMNPDAFNGIYGNRVSMQVMDIYNPVLDGGMYLIAKDSQSHYKNFFMQKADHVKMGLAYFKRALAPGQSYQLPEFGLGMHRGDWREAVSAYRKWLASWFDTSHLDDRRREWFDKINIYYAFNIHTATDNVYWDKEKKRFKIEDLIRRGEEQYGGFTHIGFSFPWYDFYSDTSLRQPAWKMEAMKTAIDELHERGLKAYMFAGYLVGVAGKSEMGEALGKKWGRVKSDGDFQSDWGEADYMPCEALPEFQDMVARIAARTVTEFDIDNLYIDTLGIATRHLCYNSLHDHPYPDVSASGVVEFLRKIREAIDEVKPGVVISGEAVGSDAMLQFIAQNLPFNLQHAAPQAEFPFIDLPRFVFTRTKFFPICTWGEDLPLRRIAFFNGEGIYLQEVANHAIPKIPYPCFYPYSERGQRLVKKVKTTLDEYYDAFTSDDPVPLVPTGNADLHANRFPGRKRTVYTFYNPTYRTISVDFPVERASSYYDIWNERKFTVIRKGGERTVPVEVGPRDVGCILVKR